MLVFNKGPKAPKPPTRTPDSLRSEDTLEVILAYSEGPTKGLADGGKSFMIDGTPLVNASGERNFGDFELLHFPGSGIDEVVRPVLGGLSNSTNVGVTLANQVAVTRTGQQHNINFLEVRLVLYALYKQTTAGDTYNATLEFELEYKPSTGGANDWQAAYFQSAPDYGSVHPTVGHPNGNFERYSGLDYDINPTSFTNAQPIERDVSGWYRAATAPVTPQLNDLWFDNSLALLKVKQWNGSSWPILSTQPSGQTQWDFTYKTQTVTMLVASEGQSTNGISGLMSGQWFKNTAIWLKPGEQTIYVLQGGAWTEAQKINPVPTTASNKVVRITGKTTSTYVKELRWGVPAIDGTYDIRIKKLSIDPGQGGNQDLVINVGWESFQEVLAGDREFPFTALYHLIGKASDQFSGLPSFSSIADGRILDVPSNYDAEALTYSGIWDGTFVKEFTANPAFVWRDVQVNDRYGISSYYPVLPNKWDIYSAAKWCDEQVSDGQGGTHARWTFNQWVTDAQGVKEFSRFLAGVFLGVYTDDGDGGVALRIDKDSNAVSLFTPENVVDGKFTYSFTDIQTRYNDLTVTYREPIMGYDENRVRVQDLAHIAKYGRIATDIVAIGCRHKQEAIRRGRARLIAATTEFTTVSFQTNRLAANFDLYDIILVADPKLGYGLTGRVKTFSNGDKTIWTLFEPIYLEPGITYVVNVQIPDPTYDGTQGAPFKLEQRALLGGHATGTVTQLQLAGAALDLPDFAWFALEAPGIVGVPKPFRVMSVSEPEGEPDRVEVVCLEVNRTKWTYIDTGENSDAIDYSSFSVAEILPPTELVIKRDKRTINGKGRVVLTLAWTKSESSNVRKYTVYAQRNDGGLVPIGESRTTDFEYIDPPIGDYVFVVTARSITDKESLPAMVVYKFIGDIAPVENPGAMRVEDAPGAGQFDVRSPSFVWG
jgi:predicted phage tail protein